MKFNPAQFSGLYHIKTHSEKDWDKNLADVQQELGSGMRLLTMTAPEIFGDDQFVRKTNQYSVYAAFNDDSDLMLKTPDYIDLETDAALLSATLEKLGMAKNVVKKIHTRLPDYFLSHQKREFTVATALLDLPVIPTAQRFYDEMTSALEEGTMDEETLCRIFESHPFRDKISSAPHYEQLMYKAATKGFSKLLYFIGTAKVDAHPSSDYGMDRYVKPIIDRGDLGEVKNFEKAYCLAGNDENKTLHYLRGIAMLRGQHEIFEAYHQRLDKEMPDEYWLGELMSVSSFDVVSHYINYLDLLKTSDLNVLTEEALARYFNQSEGKLVEFLLEKDKLDLDFFPFLKIENKMFSEFEKQLKQLKEWGFDLNQAPSEKNNFRTVPHLFIQEVGANYGEFLEKGQVKLEGDRKRLNAFKYLSICQKLGVKMSVQDKFGKTVWEAVGMTEQQLSDVLNSGVLEQHEIPIDVSGLIG